MSIPTRLEAAKARDNVTDTQAAARFGVTQQTFWKWRQGKQRPDERYLPALADWLEVDPDELRAEWHDERASGGLSEEQTESLAAQLHTLVETLVRVADRIEVSIPSDPPERPNGRSRRQVR